MALSPPSAWPDGTDVLAIDLDVRERAATEAHAAAFAAAQRFGPSARLFLKIDSTLRGPIAALIDGALAGSGLEQALVAPAFPEQGREVIDGRLRMAGRPGVLVRDV